MATNLQLLNSAMAVFLSFDQALKRAEQEVELLLQTDFRKFYAPEEQPVHTAQVIPVKDAHQPAPSSIPETCAARQRRQTWHGAQDGAQDASPAKLLLDNLAAQAAQSAEATHQLNQVHKARASKTPPVQSSGKSHSLMAEKFTVTTTIPELLFPRLRLQLTSDQHDGGATGRVLLSARGPGGMRRISSPMVTAAPLLSARGPVPPRPAGAVQRLAQRSGMDSVTPPRAALAQTPPCTTAPAASTRLAVSAGHTSAAPALVPKLALGAVAAATQAVQVQQDAEAAMQYNLASPMAHPVVAAPSAAVAQPTCSTCANASTPAAATAAAATADGSQRRSASTGGGAVELRPLLAKLDFSKVQIFGGAEPALGKPAVQQQGVASAQVQALARTPLTSRRNYDESTPLRALPGSVKVQNSRRERRMSMSGASPMSASFSGPSWRPAQPQQGQQAAYQGYAQEDEAHQAYAMYYPRQASTHALDPLAHTPGQQGAVPGSRPRRASFAFTGNPGPFTGLGQGQASTPTAGGPQYGFYVPVQGYHPAPSAGYGQYPQPAYADPRSSPVTYHSYGQAGYMSGGVWYPAESYVQQVQMGMQPYYNTQGFAPPVSNGGVVSQPSAAYGSAPPPPPSALNTTRRMQSPTVGAGAAAADQMPGGNGGLFASVRAAMPKLNLGSLRPGALQTLQEMSQRADDVAPGTDQD